MEIKLNKSNNNPFYGLRNCLNLLNAGANGRVEYTQLDNCWEEVKGNKEHREMFFSLLFSIGDITARQHNIFKGVKKDTGGNANREAFYTIFLWLKDRNKKQFIKFLNAGLFNEYVCFDNLFRSRVQSLRNGKVVKVYDIFADEWYVEELLKYVYKVINGNNPFDKFLVAKFLTIPRLSKRSKHAKMLPDTLRVMQHKATFLAKLSELMHWGYVYENNYANFKGYREWRKQYNQELESVLFSSGKIREFGRDSFINWLDKLPASARFRVRNRVFFSKNSDKLKYPQLKGWYEAWEEYKETKQEEQRILEERVRQGSATEEDKVKLNKVKKEAKVTTGATNFKELYDSISLHNVDALKVESFVQNKVNLPYNSLVIIDDSGSMSGRPFNIATFIAAVCLYKNPDDDGRNLIGMFNSSSHWHSFIDSKATSPNRILRSQIASAIHKPLVDPTKSFLDNFREIESFLESIFQGGCTNISSIPEGLRSACERYPQILDSLKSYPVWTIISDGEWNNLNSPEACMNDFMRKCENYFGFKPFVVAIDATQGWGWRNTGLERFNGIDNFMYIPANPTQIEQFLTNFKDMDIFDVYTPLQSLYRSNRYELIRVNTL
jgi:hypothetical protein|nr:MAG TPA: cobalamin biosynthesis protein [Crassvirales sp.]